MTVWGFIKGFGKLLIGLLLLLQGIVGLFLLIVILGLVAAAMSDFSGGKSEVKVPEGAALVLNPRGVIVEQAATPDPFEEALEEAFGGSDPDPIEVHDLVRAIRAAKDDERIKAIVLDLGGMFVPSSSASKLHYLADELDKFKEGGKQVVAVGDSYTQSQYLLASRADKIIMNDLGSVMMTGYGRYGTYYKSFLEKLKVTTNVFRVGTFKSAIEPFIRDDMSEPAKEANRAFLSVLWNQYASSVEGARTLNQGEVKRYANEYADILRAAGGDMAKAALDYGFVDTLMSRPDQLEFLQETFGKDKKGKSFKRIGLNKYLEALEDVEDGDAPNIAVITAAGTIVDGSQPPGVAAGGDTIAKYLKKALDDENVKAVVLRVDSGGGSAFASEVMRDGVLALKEAGKPVVVSMGSLAASGGYWISAAADEIWAAPTTITGSIGIFGFIPTFENSAAEVGVYVDGVGTSTLSPITAAGLGPIPEVWQDIFQQSIEHGYAEFLSVVAEGRGLDTAYVDEIGQGRVWIGSKALDLKLVDNLGSYDDAIAAAARLAKIETYDTVDMVEEVNPLEKFFSSMSSRALKMAGFDKAEARRHQSALRKLIAGVEREAAFFNEFNDPNGTYARCIACDGR
ncbi:MAG: signal peptide peptidase SppA [Pseudomonadota bacterium]